MTSYVSYAGYKKLLFIFINKTPANGAKIATLLRIQ